MTNTFTPPGPPQGPPPGPPPALAPLVAAPSRPWSRRRWWALGTLVAVLCLGLIIGLAYGVTRTFETALGVSGCTSADQALTVRLSELPELQMHPAKTRPVGGATRSCDGGYPDIDQSFESTGGPAEVLAYYRKELPAAGWTGVSPSAADRMVDEDGSMEEYPGPEGITCFSREFGEMTAYLQMLFPPEDGRNSTMYSLNIQTLNTAEVADLAALGEDEDGCW